ncbi:MAG: NAD-dependent epimerase/dehydratase family protein [Actinoplanes sp.]
MRVLILGGSGFVGRAVADEAVRRGAEVTVFNRGRRPAPDGVTALAGDRLADDGLDALRAGKWDAVVDTWSGAGTAVGRTAALLSGRAGWYGYVSSRSVYADDAGPHAAEDAPLVDAAEAGYAGDKLRGEIATEVFGGPVLLGRAGLILGPGEDVGRLPWWLNRLARGGPTLAPGPQDLPLQYVDARDLAAFLLDAGEQRLGGPYNLVSESGHTTMGELLEVAGEVTGGRAQLRWTDPAVILAAGIEPWTQLPVWLPPGSQDYDLLHRGDTSKARAAGLVCRPVRETVADTWAWLMSLPGEAPLRADRSSKGLDPAVEAKVLADQFG